MMNPPKHTSITRREGTIAAILFFAIFAILCSELGAPGVTWDEAYPNFPCAKNQAYWFSHLFTLEAPFAKETIDQYWQTTSDHPSLPRTIAGFSYLLFSPWMDEIIALRLPSAFYFSLLVASIYLFLRLFLDRAASLAGALSLLFMPRVFGHAHIFSLDVPIMCWWFWAAASGYLVMRGTFPPWVFGLAYAIAFTTKLHSVFLPFPLLTWVIIHGWWLHRRDKDYWLRLLWGILWAAMLTPILYIGLQPWLWHDTIPRILERFFELAKKSTVNPIGLFYFKERYLNNTPWHYPLVMLFFTLPSFIFLLTLLGFLAPWSHTPEAKSDKEVGYTTFLFLLFHFLTPITIILLPLAQGYDGCRLFLPAFPFIACLAGWGYRLLADYAQKKFPLQIVHILLFAFLILPPVYTYYSIHPFYLAYYNPIAGGVSGAKKLGMETTYWCDALTLEFVKQVDEIIPEEKTLKPASMSFSVIEYYRERGLLHADIADPGDYYLVQFRQGMFSRMEWYLTRYKKPLASVRVDGVPLFALYEGDE